MTVEEPRTYRMQVRLPLDFYPATIAVHHDLDSLDVTVSVFDLNGGELNVLRPVSVVSRNYVRVRVGVPCQIVVDG